MKRREFITALGGAAAAWPTTRRLGWAQSYPSQPVRIIVGFPPGGAADITARLMAQWLSDHLGQSFVVENRPGAGTNIATEAVTKSPANGYTLLLVSMANAVNATLYERLNFDFIRDIVPVAGVGAVLAVANGGQTIRVRIAGVERDASDQQGEILLYDFRLITSRGEEPLCMPDPDGRRLGFPLAGRSDPAGILSPGDGSSFELVCTSGAQGKCARLGYAPWRRAADGRPMIDWYNSCVRLMRGDYCGDGRPFTRDGTLVDVYDRLGIHASDADQRLAFEAAWGPEGAVCVARTRLPDLIDLDELRRACPRLAGRLGPAACSENAPGGLIFNRSLPGAPR